MAERSEDQILDQVVYAVLCAYQHYGPGFSEEGKIELRELLSKFTVWSMDASYKCDVCEDDPYVDFSNRIIWPDGWKKI